MVLSDAPDWGAIPASWRYIGATHQTVTGELDVNLGPAVSDNALLVIPGGLLSTNDSARVLLQEPGGQTMLDTTMHRLAGENDPRQPVIGFISSQITGTWTLRLILTNNSTLADITWFVFLGPTNLLTWIIPQGNGIPVYGSEFAPAVSVALTGFPDAVTSPIGQRLSSASFPVVIASDQSAVAIGGTRIPAALVGGRFDTNVGSWLGSTVPTVGAKASASSLPVVIATDIAAGRSGQQTQANSLPIVSPSNGLGPGYSWRMPYDAEQVSQPAANVVATVTLAATSNRRWVVDQATFSLRTNAATAVNSGVSITDGAAVVWASELSVPATANARDQVILGPNAAYFGSLGNAVVVAFAAAAGATSIEKVSVGAYLLPAGV